MVKLKALRKAEASAKKEREKRAKKIKKIKEKMMRKK